MEFSNKCNWFVDNELSIKFGKDKTKSILFASKFKRKKKLNVNMGLYKSNNILNSST